MCDPEVPTASARITERFDRAVLRAFGQLEERPLLEVRVDSHVDPCHECVSGECGHCEGRSIDHAQDAVVECPCKSAGHVPCP